MAAPALYARGSIFKKRRSSIWRGKKKGTHQHRYIYIYAIYRLPLQKKKALYTLFLASPCKKKKGALRYGECGVTAAALNTICFNFNFFNFLNTIPASMLGDVTRFVGWQTRRHVRDGRVP